MKKRILGFMLSLAMIASVAISPMISYATSEEAGAPTQMEIDNYRKSKETVTDVEQNEYSWYSETPDAPEGYVFGGWYTTVDCTTPIGKDVVDGEAWAKWVPQSVLSVKYQITAGTTTETAETALRVITTVDSLNYQKVGFTFTYEGKSPRTLLSNKVYETIIGQVNGTEKIYEPKTTFSEAANYFMVVEMAKLPHSAFAADLVVDPVWVTLDGTKVVGARNTVNVSEVATVNDFSEGITFENRTEINRFTVKPASHGDYCKPEVVSYPSDIVAGESTYGEKGLVVTKQTSATSNSNIRFYMDFGREIPKNSVVTFDVYIQGEVVDTASSNPKISLKKDGGTFVSAQKIRYTPNQWDEALFTLDKDDANQVCLIIIELQKQFAGKEVKVYMDNFVIQTPYSAGIDFETKSQATFLTEAGTGEDKRSHPSRVLYSTTGLDVSEEHGLYGIQCKVATNGTYPAFYLDWGKDVVAAGDTVTFRVYVKAEGYETLNYKIESKSWDANDTRTNDTVKASIYDSKNWNVVNDWYDVTVSFNGEAPVKEWVIFNFGNAACQDAVATGKIQFYVDNFKVIKAN